MKFIILLKRRKTKSLLFIIKKIHISNRAGGVLISLQDSKVFVVNDSKRNDCSFRVSLNEQPELEAEVSKELTQIDLALWTHDYLEDCYTQEQVIGSNLRTLKDWENILNLLDKANIPYTIGIDTIVIEGYEFDIE